MTPEQHEALTHIDADRKRWMACELQVDCQISNAEAAELVEEFFRDGTKPVGWAQFYIDGTILDFSDDPDEVASWESEGLPVKPLFDHPAVAEAASAEPLADEFARLVREYREDPDSPTGAEAWNYIADFAVANANILTAALQSAADTPAPQTQMEGVPEEIFKLTFAIQHNPNCPWPWLVRLPGKGPIDFKPYRDAIGIVPHQTGDVLGFGKTLGNAARAALAIKEGFAE